MRIVIFCFAALGFNGALLAADPFLGTWKLDSSKSIYQRGTPPKEEIITIVAAGSNLNVMIQSTSAEGEEISSRYSVPAGGGEGKIIQSPYEGVSSTRLSPYRREV